MNEAAITVLRDFRDKLETNGVISKSEVLSLEQHYDINVFSTSGVTKYLTDIPSSNGMVEVKRVLDKQLENTSHFHTTLTFEMIINELKNIRSDVNKLSRDICYLPDITDETTEIMLDQKYALVYEENVLKDITKDSDILVALNSYDYISKIFEHLFTDPQELSKKLAKHEEIIKSLNQNDIKEYVGYLPFISKLLSFRDLELEPLDLIKKPANDKINVETILELYKDKHSISYALEKAARYIDSIYNINSPHILCEYNFDYNNTLYNDIKNGLNIFTEIPAIDSMVLNAFINFFTSSSEYKELKEEYKKILG